MEESATRGNHAPVRGHASDDTMTDLPNGTEGAARPSQAGSADAEMTPRPAGSTKHKLVAGRCWQNYQIDGPVSSVPGQAFYATHLKLTEKVVIYPTPVTEATVWRRGAWERLSSLPPHARVVGCVEAQEEEGWRYEVMRVPPASTMRDWICSHQASAESVRSFLQQLSVTLSTLHGQGVVHLNIRPESIYLDDSTSEMQIRLGGFEAATLYTEPGMKLDKVDPFYAPPEAVGADEFPPGTGLCSWDWWSVGRVLQEFVLGRHVAGLLFNGDVTRPTPELVAQTHNLMRDVDPMMPRAGAVEAMAGMALDSTVQTLLSGLLTASRDARWGRSNVERWLKGDTIKIYYDLPRKARLFIWKGRVFALEEAIEHFSTEENWAEGEAILLPPDNPETLAHFLATVPEHAADYSRLQACRALLELPAWQGMSSKVRNSLFTSAAWLLLGSEHGKRKPLQFRGRPIEKASLTGWLGKQAALPGLEIVGAMTAAPFIKLIEPLDSVTAKMLERLSRVSGEAMRQALQAGWIKQGESDVFARVLNLALESDAALQVGAEKIRKSYATCHDAGVLRLLQLAKPEPWEQVLLILTAGSPARYGYVSKEEQARQSSAEVKQQNRRLETAAFWRQLHRVLTAGSAWTGRWRVFGTIWVGLILIGLLLAQDPLVTALLATTFVGIRVLLGVQTGRLVRANDPDAGPWTWRDSPQRCLVELQRVDPEATSVALVATKGLSGFKGLWGTMAAAAVLMIVLASQLGVEWRAKLSSPRDTDLTPRDVAAVRQLMPGITADLAARVVSGEYEIVDKGFGRQLSGPLRKWTFTSPDNPSLLPVVGSQPASPAQTAFAQVSATLLLKSFGQQPINALIAVQVPAQAEPEVMLFDGRKRRMADGQSLRLAGSLQAETWYKIDRRRVFFMGVPEGMTAWLGAGPHGVEGRARSP